jgi:protein TonB
MPANDNARYYYELALSNDPGNTVAQQGLTIVASKLVLRAREAIDSGQLDDAERFLENATALDSGSADLSASLQALESAKAQRQEELEREAALAREAEADPATENLTGESDTEGEAASPALETVDSLDDALADTENSSSEGTGTADGRAQSDAGPQEYVAVSTLKRTNYVAPRYPRAAQRRNITGWVDVSFTVNHGGSVVDVGILDSSPGDVFINSATEAVSQWRFEPSTENGVPVERLVAVRLMFDLE